MLLNRNQAAFAASLEARARAADSVAQLCFSIANDAYAALQFRQALVLDARGKVLTVSGLAKLEEDSPYLLWLKRSWPWVQRQLQSAPAPDGEPDSVIWFVPTAEQLSQAPGDVADGWQEWWPAGVLVAALRQRNQESLGWVCFLLDQSPPPPVLGLLRQVAQSWAYCWEMLAGQSRKSLKKRWGTLGALRKHLMLVILAALLFIPVRQSVLAPAEIIPTEALAITAALDGVVKTVHVRPNQPVKAGDALFSLDDTTLRNRLEVARTSVAVADAQLRAAIQMSFNDIRSKTELTVLRAQAQEKRAELASVQAQLQRVNATAPYDGIAVFVDADEWQGRPVITGERIMLLANPNNPGMLINLPVADAITMDAGAPVELFLTIRPLSRLSGQITETSYQASISDEGVASYRLRASISADADARIGLRGTAKLYGRRVSLAYYLMRRPLATLREWTGL